MLNYHHLLYFWLVAREGGVAKAAAKLRLAHPTVSGQIHALEDVLGEKLFERQGRKLVLTEMGRVVYGYADEIFTLGRELLDTVKGRPTGRPLRLVVGVAEVVPKLVAKRLLDPARALPEAVRIVCREDKADRLVAELAAGGLDVVLTDSPLPSGGRIRAFNHFLGETEVALFATAPLGSSRRRPRSRPRCGASTTSRWSAAFRTSARPSTPYPPSAGSNTPQSSRSPRRRALHSCTNPAGDPVVDRSA